MRTIDGGPRDWSRLDRNRPDRNRLDRHRPDRHRLNGNRAAGERAGWDPLGRHRTDWDWAGWDRLGRHRTGWDWLGRHRTGWDWAGWDRLGRDWAGWASIGWDRLGRDRAGRDRPAWDQLSWDRLSWDRLSWDPLGWDRQDWNRAGRIAGTLVGTATAAAGFSLALLMRQAADARRIIPMAEAPPPRGDGLYGPKFGGKPLNMVILGDSSAAGYGVHRPRETPGALLATGVSRRLRRPVRLHRLAVVGSMSSGLPYQVDAALEYGPEVAVVLIGANDVTHLSDRTAAVRYLGDAVRRLRAAGCLVVVGTCPDIGAIQPIKPPLRWLVRVWSRQLAAAQTVAVVEAGGRTVSIGDLLGRQFEADPARMFSADRFHPSAEGYARAAAVMMPTLMAALGEDDRAATGTDGVRSLPEAAQEAVRAAGTEVSAAQVNGRERGPAGRWAELRRHPWFGEQRLWFGHRATNAPEEAVPRSRSSASAVGWRPEGGVT